MLTATADGYLNARSVMGQFGPVRQLGFVVNDLNEAIRRWTDLGVGPFFVAESPAESDQLYFGEPTGSRVRGAWSCAGAMQIELLQLIDDEPSLLRDFALEHGEGLQHIAYWVDLFDDAVAHVQRHGYQVGQTGSPIGPNSRFAYVFHPSSPGKVVEISEFRGRKRELYTAIEDEARRWNGDNPVRMA